MIFEFNNFPICVVVQEPSEHPRKVLIDLSSISMVKEGSCYASNDYENNGLAITKPLNVKQEFVIITHSGKDMYFCSLPETIRELQSAYKRYKKQSRRDIIDYNFDEVMLNHAKATIGETITTVANSALKDLSGICSEAQESVAKINALSLNVNGIDAKIEEACESTNKLATTVDKLTRKINKLVE